MSQMTGKDWVVVVLVAVLAVLLSTMSSWWGQLVFTVGFKLALLIVAIVIAILVIAIVAMMIAAPDWWDNLFNTFAGNSEQLLNVAAKGVENASVSLASGVSSVFSKLWWVVALGGGLWVLHSVLTKKETNSEKDSNRH